jgi:hypothetical protein
VTSSRGWNHPKTHDVNEMPQATAAPADVVRQLIDAFNARDIERFFALVSDDLEIRTPLGKAVRGLAGAREFMKANDQMGVFVEQDGAERVDGTEVAVPPIMRMSDGTELRSTGLFEVRESKVARLRILMDRAAAGP